MNSMTNVIHYALEPNLSATEFQALLVASTLAERRPATDLERLTRMLAHADIIVTARLDGRLVGVSRAVTDFAYCCYLSDLAVDAAHQKRGIGTRLIAETHQAAGPETSLILLSAPAAESYYPKIGMTRAANCFMSPRSH